MRTIRTYLPTSPIILSFFLFLVSGIGCEKKPIPLPDHPGGQIFHGIKRADVRCAKCHGDRGEGSARAPALVQSGKTLPPSLFVATVLEGRNRMPPFRSVLTEAEILEIVDWLSKVPLN
jgi:hypothetical protein